MAGSYPDVPDHRIAYDRDGTAGFWVRVDTPGSVRTIDTTGLRNLNNEDESVWYTWGDGNANTPMWVGFIFPTPRTLAAYFVGYVEGAFAGNRGVDAVQTSADTMTGLDGTWATWDGSPASSLHVATYRSAIRDIADAAGVKAVRFAFPNLGAVNLGSLGAIHLYGPQASTLRLWHPTLDQALGGAAQDWGDIAAGSSASRQFRVKNTHATQTAHSIAVTAEALIDKSPSAVTQRAFSYAGSTPAASVNIGDLAPGAISGVVAVDRVTAAGSQAGLGALRYVAQAGSWS